jgi:hypothetical protein
VTTGRKDARRELSTDCSTTQTRNAGKQEKAIMSISWFPVFLIFRIPWAAELGRTFAAQQFSSYLALTEIG